MSRRMRAASRRFNGHLGNVGPSRAFSIDKARPGRWIAQRYFEARLDAAGEATNLGVFLIAGQAAGFYARVSPGATDG
jgi:hypothetical protein